MDKSVKRYIIDNLLSGPMTKAEIASRTGVPIEKVRQMAAKMFAKPQQRGTKRGK